MEFTPQILEPNFCTVLTNLRARPHEVLALGAAIYGSSSRPDILSIDPYAAIWAIESASAMLLGAAHCQQLLCLVWKANWCEPLRYFLNVQDLAKLQLS